MRTEGSVPSGRDRPISLSAGRIVGPKRAPKEKQVWAIRFYLSSQKRVRDRAMFDIAIGSKLRGCDVVQLRVSGVTSGSHIRTRSTVVQQKTGRPVQFEINATARDSLAAWLHLRGGTLDNYLFPSRVGRCPHIGTRQYARLVYEWVSAIGLQPEDYGTHSLRRTKASLIYKRTGNLQAVQILLGHTKIESTVRYLSVDIKDALAISEATDI